MRRKFSFLHVDIQFDMSQWEFNLKSSSLIALLRKASLIKTSELNHVLDVLAYSLWLPVFVLDVLGVLKYLACLLVLYPHELTFFTCLLCYTYLLSYFVSSFFPFVLHLKSYIPKTILQKKFSFIQRSIQNPLEHL